MNQKALQEQLGIEAGSLSELLSKMEGKGLLYRERDEEDRRRMVVRLSEKGRDAARENTGSADDGDLFAALREEEKDQLRSILERLLRQWKAERDLSDRRFGRDEAEGRPDRGFERDASGEGFGKNSERDESGEGLARIPKEMCREESFAGRRTDERKRVLPKTDD